MKYINTTISLYDDVREDQGRKCYIGLFDNMRLSRTDGALRTPNFKVVTNFNLLGTASEDKKANNQIEQREGCLHVVIRLTKCDADENKRLGIDLDRFDIVIEELQDKICHACFHYLNYTRVTDVKPFVLEPGTGLYVVKVLAGWKGSAEESMDDSALTVQSMYSLKVSLDEQSGC